jgi:tetratricopeptide (TPR) repeat protein
MLKSLLTAQMFVSVVFSKIRITRFSLAAFLVGAAVLATASHAAAQDDEEPGPNAAITLFEEGQDLHEKGKLLEALARYEKALEVLPEFPEAEYQRGSVLLSLDRRAEAEKAFRKAVDLRSDWTLALAGLGSLLVSEGRYKEAESYLVRAIALDDQNFPAYSALTELRLNSKADAAMLREMLVKIEALSRKANPPSSIWAARGAIENALGERAAARKSFEKALELDPKSTFALTQVATAAIDAGNLDRAETAVRTLESVAPASATTRVTKARFLLASGRPAEAVSELNSIKDPAPDVIAFRNGILSASATDPAELEKNLAADPKNAMILGRLCTLLRVDDPPRALEFCRRASEADPMNINHAIGYGAALLQAKMYTQAAGLFRELIKLAPENATIRSNLAGALFQLKRFPEAKAEFQWISDHRPELAATYYFLGIIHDQLGEYLDAMANYQQFLRRADTEKNKLEIEKVNLRLPVLQRQLDGKKNKRG